LIHFFHSLIQLFASLTKTAEDLAANLLGIAVYLIDRFTSNAVAFFGGLVNAFFFTGLLQEYEL
jgi:hypothetical protein